MCFFKSVNICYGYKQKRVHLVHFLRLLAVCAGQANEACKQFSLIYVAINLFNLVINNPTTP